MFEKFKSSIKNLNDNLEKKSFDLQKAYTEKQKVRDTNCKKLYLEIISNPEKIDQLYKNTDVIYEFVDGKITKDQFEVKMKKHKENIDKILKKIDINNVTCDDLAKLYRI